MKRRGFLGVLLGTPVAALAVQAPKNAEVEHEPFTHIGKSKIGFVRVDSDVTKGDKLFCSRRDDKTVDAWVTGGKNFHAYALHDVSWKALDTGGKGLVPAQLTVAVRFI